VTENLYQLLSNQELQSCGKVCLTSVVCK